jgi:Ni/Co efflux regulator RcnB
MKTGKLMAGLMAVSMMASQVVVAQSTNQAPAAGMSEQGAGFNSVQEPSRQRAVPQMQREQPGASHTSTQAAASNSSGNAAHLQSGAALPKPYNSKQYIVNNWQSHGLTPPGKNQHWVQVGVDYVLVTSSGVIRQIQTR